MIFKPGFFKPKADFVASETVPIAKLAASPTNQERNLETIL